MVMRQTLLKTILAVGMLALVTTTPSSSEDMMRPQKCSAVHSAYASRVSGVCGQCIVARGLVPTPVEGRRTQSEAARQWRSGAQRIRQLYLLHQHHGAPSQGCLFGSPSHAVQMVHTGLMWTIPLFSLVMMGSRM